MSSPYVDEDLCIMDPDIMPGSSTTVVFTELGTVSGALGSGGSNERLEVFISQTESDYYTPGVYKVKISAWNNGYPDSTVDYTFTIYVETDPCTTPGDVSGQTSPASIDYYYDT